MHKFKKYLKKIKIIDLVLIVAGLFVIGYLLFSFKRTKQSIYVELTFSRNSWTSELVPPESWQLAEIKKGSVVYNTMGKNIANVIEVEKTPWGGGVRSFIDVVLKVDAILDPRTHKYLLNGKPLLIGDNFTFELKNTLFEGEIKNIYLHEEDKYKEYQQVKAEVTVLYREYEAWHAESLRDFTFSDSEGNTLVKTKDIKITPAEIAVSTDDGLLRQTHHPFKKDILIILSLDGVLCLDGICNFQNQNLLIGSEFWIDSGFVYMGGGSIQDVKIIYE